MSMRRRQLLNASSAFTLAALLRPRPAAANETSFCAPDNPLQALMDGNLRFRSAWQAAKNDPEAKEEANPIKWWSYDAIGSGAELLASKEVTGYKPTACFKVDYAKYCELLSIKPHPCVVAVDEVPEPPAEPEQEPTKVVVKNHLLDAGTLNAFVLAMPKCEALASLVLYNVGLDASMLAATGAITLGSSGDGTYPSAVSPPTDYDSNDSTEHILGELGTSYVIPILCLLTFVGEARSAGSLCGCLHPPLSILTSSPILQVLVLVLGPLVSIYRAACFGGIPFH